MILIYYCRDGTHLFLLGSTYFSISYCRGRGGRVPIFYDRVVLIYFCRAVLIYYHIVVPTVGKYSYC